MARLEIEVDYNPTYSAAAYENNCPLFHELRLSYPAPAAIVAAHPPTAKASG